MLTFILFLMGMFVMWRWVLYLWCENCGQNVRDSLSSKLCGKCRGRAEAELEKILDGH